MDWNNDGRKDLVLGEYDGSIRIYLNTGTDEDPAFSGFTYIQVGGVKFDCGSYSTPHIMDWNKDGRKDVICGESAGRVWLLINRGTDANPKFTSNVYLQNGGSLLDVGSRSSPTVADWNRDGMKDLLSGDQNGYITCFENKGTDANPVFNGSSKLMIGAAVLDAGYTSRPDVADWDGDGVTDILCGEYNGTVTYYHALGPLSLSDNRIIENTGGVIVLKLNVGPSHGGRTYLMLGSVSGTFPGTPLPGGKAVLPINWDFFTSAVVAWLNTPVFQNFTGSLNGNGEAKAVFDTLGPVPGSAGLMLSFAYALNKPWDCASNGANIEIVP